METNKPLYSQIIEYLKEKINNKELLPYQQLPTEMELAQQFDVSRITSKRALSELEKAGLIYRERGKGSFVNPQPPLLGTDKWSSDAKGMHNVIAMVIPNKESTGNLIDYILGASDYLAQSGYNLTIHASNANADVERKLLTDLPEQGVKGIIYYPVRDNNNLELLNSLYMNDYPLVTIDKHFEIPISYAVSDNFSGGYKAVSHLIALGHQRIAYVSGAGLESATSVRNRYFGYCRGLKEHGLDISKDLVALDFSKDLVQSPSKNDYYKSMIESLMRQGATAIQVGTDLQAIRILKVCMDMGISVPEQLSIVGFDDIEICKHLDIPLTTVAQDFMGIGRKAAEIVVNYVESGTNPNERIILPVTLIERNSSAPAGGAMQQSG